jgi:hypothetical protein
VQRSTAGETTVQNKYEATIRVGSGHEKVTVQAKDLYHAKMMLENLYGRNNFMNVHQVY